MTTALRPHDPRQLGPYEILSRIGSGGMGTVFLGRAPGGRPVAIKVIRPEYASEDEFRGRFRSEVDRARQVPPFCTAEVLDADPEHATPYLVVEYVDGPDLAEVVRENGPLTGGALHSVAVGVATALAAIHGAGVVHRDLKPRNVLFALGSPKVIDFGIARAMEATSRHTRTDQMVGTLAYMAPERFDPETDHLVGPAADVFAWGAVVAYAGTGRTPFAGDTPAVTAARILTQPPDLTGLPPGLADLVRRTLAKDPAERPTAYELLDLLLSARTGDPRDGGTAPELAPGLRRAAEAAQGTGRHRSGTVTRPGRRRLPAILAGALAIAAVAATALVLGLGDDDRKAPAALADLPSASASAPSAVVRAPAVIDSLARYGQWRENISGNDGLRCDFTGQMVLTVNPGAEDYCLGPSAVFAGDQSIAVDVTLGGPSSCAVIWLRVVEPNGYRLLLCAGRTELGVDLDGAVTPVTSADAGLTAGRRQRVTILVGDGTATVTAGATTLLTAPLTEPALIAGEVRLGATTEGPRSRVSYADAELRSLPAASSAAFTDLTAPDLDTTARITEIWDIFHSVVLESAVVREAGGRRTAQGSQTLVTLPLSPDATFFAPHFDSRDPRKCFDPKTHVATCPREEEAFEGWIRQLDGPWVVSVRIRDGVVVRMAAIDLS